MTVLRYNWKCETCVAALSYGTGDFDVTEVFSLYKKKNPDFYIIFNFDYCPAGSSDRLINCQAEGDSGCRKFRKCRYWYSG